MEQDTDFDLGIDIGSSAVRVVLTRPIKKNGKETTLEIVGLGKATCEGVSKGVINNLDQTADAIKLALNEALTKSGYAHHSMPDSLFANVNVSGKHIVIKSDFNTITRTTSGNAVKKEDISKLFADVKKTVVPDEMTIVHVLPIDFVVDGDDHIPKPVGRIGGKLGGEFQIITANSSKLNYIEQALKGANPKLERSEFIVSPLSASLSVLDDIQKQRGVAVVDIGSGTTDLVIFHKGITRHIAILPFAGKQITSDIEEGCNLDYESAESAKFAISNSDPASCLDNMLLVGPTTDGIPPLEIVAKNVAKIIQARLREIAAMVYAEIKQAGYERKLAAGIVLVGGSSKIQNIEKTFTQITGISAQIGKLKGIEKINVNDQISSDSSWATALGLVWLDVKKLDSRMIDFDLDNIEPHRPNVPPVPQTPDKKKSVWQTIKGFTTDNLDDYTKS
jgi:cell division protein FtsA